MLGISYCGLFPPYPASEMWRQRQNIMLDSGMTDFWDTNRFVSQFGDGSFSRGVVGKWIEEKSKHVKLFVDRCYSSNKYPNFA